MLGSLTGRRDWQDRGMTESFPRQQARTRRFSLGVPRSFRVAPDGGRVAFLRSKTGTDPLTCLWQLHVATGQEELVADPAALDAAEGDLPAAEKARRERAREQAGGIVGYATNRDLRVAVFTLGGRVYLTELADLGSPAGPPRRDRRAAPGARRPGRTRMRPHIGYVSAGALHVIDVRTGQDQVLADLAARPPVVRPGRVHRAEEMGRLRGYWWAPDGSAILAARWTSGRCSAGTSPTRPTRTRQPRTSVTQPRAPPNADVSLLLARLDGSQAEVSWDRAAVPLPGHGELGLGRAAAGGAEPGPAPDATVSGRPGHRRDHADPRGHRPEVGGRWCPGCLPDTRRAARLDGRRRRGAPPAAGQHRRAPGWHG